MNGADEVTSVRHRHSFWVQVPLLVALVALWLVLWGHVDVISVVTGIVFSIVVVEIFYMPNVELSGRFSLWHATRFVVIFLWKILAAAFQVAWYAFRPSKPPTSSVLEIDLRTKSDLILTLTAEANILVPGSVTVETDRIKNLIFLHVIDADTPEKVEAAREVALHLEALIALAIGSRDDVWRINVDRRARGLKPVGQSRKQRDHEARADEVERRRASGTLGPIGPKLQSEYEAEAAAPRRDKGVDAR